ncbi:MAG: 2-amino-4-hydroxy-6-hydroxymethyldihydropteridine diphosphokinase [Clostridiales bacterium]|nr:2-amino-4-hydroxy-6-hydroxymethyldihydropteridine diphosphokinase [Clostridiales bacterium]
MSAQDEKLVLLSIGSNMGDREANIAFAEERLEECGQIRSLKKASLYETDPVGYTDQPDFLNTCVSFLTTLGPEELLDLTSGIENDCKRVRTIRWGPRTLDIDIIFYGDEKIDTPRLTVPHPRWQERAFVIIPAKELMELDVPVPDDSVRLYKSRV